MQAFPSKTSCHLGGLSENGLRELAKQAMAKL
jgi:hypothetical protein